MVDGAGQVREVECRDGLAIMAAGAGDLNHLHRLIALGEADAATQRAVERKQALCNGHSRLFGDEPSVEMRYQWPRGILIPQREQRVHLRRLTGATALQPIDLLVHRRALTLVAGTPDLQDAVFQSQCWRFRLAGDHGHQLRLHRAETLQQH